MTSRRYLVFHTAFLGDIVLVLPLLQALRNSEPSAFIALVTTPAAASIVQGHPAVDEVIPYAKRTDDRGLKGILRLASSLRSRKFDVALVPHRSLRSALVVSLARIPQRIGFERSAGRWLFTEVVKYRSRVHEIDRNLDLLVPLGIRPSHRILPQLPVNPTASGIVDSFIEKHEGGPGGKLIAIAPGSVWATKRWPADRFAIVARELQAMGHTVLLVGGAEDVLLCNQVAEGSGFAPVVLAGRLSIRESAEAIRACAVLITNDSAPQHLGVAVGTPVIAIFGATAPTFGFAPVGPNDHVVETLGLECRPCAIHGGRKCPNGTIACMLSIEPTTVVQAVQQILAHS